MGSFLLFGFTASWWPCELQKKKVLHLISAAHKVFSLLWFQTFKSYFYLTKCLICNCKSVFLPICLSWYQIKFYKLTNCFFVHCAAKSSSSRTSLILEAQTHTLLLEKYLLLSWTLNTFYNISTLFLSGMVILVNMGCFLEK